MKQVKPARSRSIESAHESHLPRPQNLKAGERRAPDPEGHARALIQAHGVVQAAAISENNVGFTGDDYWRQVWASVARIASAGGQRTH